MKHPPIRSIRGAAVRTAVLAVGVPLLLLGCDSKRPSMSGNNQSPAAAGDGGTAALAALETQPDFDHCRTALQQLEAQPSAADRRALSDAEQAELARLLKLTPAEAVLIGQTNFATADAAYLEECLLVRAGVRSLRVDELPPLERAGVVFDWACRMVFASDRIPWPANPWSSLEGGLGVPLSRAYVILAAWQQAGLDGCLVGPPALKTTRSVNVNPLNPEAVPDYAPVRACGVLVGTDIYLFDPAAGKPFTGGKEVLTLDQARKKPDTVPGSPAAEVQTWQPFLAPPLHGLSPRMEWLEGRNPGGSGVRLFVNATEQKGRFGGERCEAWNPAGDEFTATRILNQYASDDGGDKRNVQLRDRHRLGMIPLERMPKTNLTTSHLAPAFARPFDALRWSLNTPRDLLLRGQFKEATSALEDFKKMVENARSRIDQDPNLRKDFERWADQFQALAAKTLRPDPSDAGGAQAQKALEQFRNNPASRDIERAFVLGTASRPLAAEVTYLMAECVHERAERAERDRPGSAPPQWRNAVEWWQRYLDASAQANAPFPARDPHARALLARAQEFAEK